MYSFFLAVTLTPFDILPPVPVLLTSSDSGSPVSRGLLETFPDVDFLGILSWLSFFCFVP